MFSQNPDNCRAEKRSGKLASKLTAGELQANGCDACQQAAGLGSRLRRHRGKDNAQRPVLDCTHSSQGESTAQTWCLQAGETAGHSHDTAVPCAW